MWYMLLGGSVFFPGLYLLSRRCARLALPAWTMADCALFSSRVVSIVQGILAATAGIIVTTSCKDVKLDRHWLAKGYLCFMMPYMVYDYFAMYLYHWHKCQQLNTSNGKDHFTAAINSLLRKDFLMLAHHTVILTVLAPIGLYSRRQLGDFFVGCLYIIELSTPFVSFGKILMQLKLQNSVLHKVNGIIVVLTFFTCRILLFPYMYYAYGRQFGVPLYKVPFSIPLPCNVLIAIIMAPQVHWFRLICKKAIGLFFNSSSSKDR